MADQKMSAFTAQDPILTGDFLVGYRGTTNSRFDVDVIKAYMTVGLFNTTANDSDNITEGAANLFLTVSERAVIGNTSGTNTGDQDLSGLMTKAAYDAANVAEQLVGLTASQTLTNKTVNGVVLSAAGAATVYLNGQGNYTTPAGGGDMSAATYDPATIAEQLVGLTATQTLTNKTLAAPVITGNLSVAGQMYSPTNTLTDGASIATDCDTGNVHTVTLAGNRTLANPTNLQNGSTYIWVVKQDATGSRTLSFGSAFKFPSGTAPTLSTAANAVDIITGVSDGTNIYVVGQLDFS